MDIPSLIRSRTNFNYVFFARYFGDRPFRLLDIGSGNRSATKTTRVFPNCEYHGLDITSEYNYDPADFSKMKAFYEIDLTTLNYQAIPDEYFDAIRMVHVIEHLPNGEKVVAQLTRKLKKGGYFYIEYPGKKSLTLPSMQGTLNFHDDPTHVRVYSVAELKQVFEEQGCQVIKSGTRRNWFYITAMPLRILGSVIRGKKVQANVFWDLTGFAELLLARKK